ncbi:uncharacterized protein LOC108670119 [Hyalella azteca]|uniref:Uncharacterized protein LOC108670119 n=1 Tax=Hyalella azteca TaxID=294128 RepID=A0A8B7NHE6_HYAAZ|nr:uncharacterized protein LOC108670119 [Hyalella azteca]XP_047740212.1 uncharacterized protein LOC108670119 [Hyalella azteca]
MAAPKKPMEEFEEEFIKLEIEEIAAKYKFHESLRGKWMMFFENESMNDMWAKAVELYSAGELPGVISIKASTAAHCARSSDPSCGAIRFKCGPLTDRELVLQYGQQLVKKMQYCDTLGFVAYKTDGQSRIGTKATGTKKNYLYRLPVPTYAYLQQRSGMSSELPTELPCLTSHSEWLSDVVGDYIQDPADLSDYARWTMQFPKKLLHGLAWVRACRLYRGGELVDVAFMRASTDKAKPGKEKIKGGIISFFCRDNLPLTRLQLCGENLVEKLKYFHISRELKCVSYKSASNKPEYIELCRVPTLESHRRA